MQLRNFVRRHKWRLRPLKKFVLPARRAKRALAGFIRRPPAIKRTADYRGQSFAGVKEIFPACQVIEPPSPFGPQQAGVDLVSEPALVYQFKNVQFWARYGGSVITADRCLLADLSPEVWGTDNHPIFSKIALPQLRHLPGRSAIAVTPEAVGNYYHWLLDLLPRAALIQSFASGGFDRLLINGSRQRYELDSLTALGIPSEKIFYVTERDRFEIAHALIPSMDHAAKTVAPWKIEALRKLRDSIPVRPALARRIYISRRRAAVRRIINEAAVVDVLRRANFSFIELDDMAWADQVAIVSAAETIVAPHGAALANIAFCRPQTCVAEIATRSGYKDFYRHLASSAGLRYRVLEAQPRAAVGKNSARPAENEDMSVDLELVRNFIEELG